MMVARARIYEETGDVYQHNLNREAKVMKLRLRGQWVWKTFYPIDTMDNLPHNAKVYERNPDTGEMVQGSTFDPKNKQHFVKFPPYVSTPERKRLTFSQQRKLIDASKHQDIEEEGTINNDTGAEG